MAILLLILSANVLHGQSVENKPDQITLMKKFLGSWTCDYRPDTVLSIRNTPFGEGMISTSYIISKKDTLESIIQLYGYDKKTDGFLMAELIQSSAVLEICKMHFISENEGEMEVTNTANAQFQWRFEFTDPDHCRQQALLGDEVVKEVSMYRSEVESQ